MNKTIDEIKGAILAGAEANDARILEAVGALRDYYQVNEADKLAASVAWTIIRGYKKFGSLKISEKQAYVLARGFARMLGDYCAVCEELLFPPVEEAQAEEVKAEEAEEVKEEEEVKATETETETTQNSNDMEKNEIEEKEDLEAKKEAYKEARGFMIEAIKADAKDNAETLAKALRYFIDMPGASTYGRAVANTELWHYRRLGAFKMDDVTVWLLASSLVESEGHPYCAAHGARCFGVKEDYGSEVRKFKKELDAMNVPFPVLKAIMEHATHDTDYSRMYVKGWDGRKKWCKAVIAALGSKQKADRVSFLVTSLHNARKQVNRDVANATMRAWLYGKDFEGKARMRHATERVLADLTV